MMIAGRQVAAVLVLCALFVHAEHLDIATKSSGERIFSIIHNYYSSHCFLYWWQLAKYNSHWQNSIISITSNLVFLNSFPHALSAPNRFSYCIFTSILSFHLFLSPFSISSRVPQFFNPSSVLSLLPSFHFTSFLLSFSHSILSFFLSFAFFIIRRLLYSHLSKAQSRPTNVLKIHQLSISSSIVSFKIFCIVLHCGPMQQLIRQAVVVRTRADWPLLHLGNARWLGRGQAKNLYNKLWNLEKWWTFYKIWGNG